MRDDTRMTRIFDNIKDQLGEHLRITLNDFNRMDVAVGYFNLRGWRMFDDLVNASDYSHQPVARILIGMVTGGPQEEALDRLQEDVEGRDDEDADRSVANERKAVLLEQLRVQLMRGLPTATDRTVLRSLRELISLGRVEVKVFTRRPLHGKTYIFYREDANNPITGFVGSSNLTAPGLTSNLELNVDVVDNVAAADLSQWFNDRWNDRFSRPVTAELLDLLDESWATPIPRRPYEVFLKVCYDLSRDVREGVAEYSIPPEVASQLLDYQTTAVRTLARRIVTRGGTMLGDVVGLGKTLTAVAVALMLRDEHGYIPLVLCPRNLVEMWEEHFEAYDLHGRVVPYSQVHTVLPSLRRYPFVIADESHTLRNSERRDYTAVHEYIQSNESKVLLLTATPFNLRFRDVANQLGLYINDDDDLGIMPSDAMRADPRLADKVDGKITTFAAFKRSEEPEDWRRLMSEQLVRRTRSFIKNNYAHRDESGREFLEFSNGDHFSFPQRIARPLEHSFGPSEPAALMASDDTLLVIQQLLLPRYQLVDYISPTTALTDNEKIFAQNIARGHGQVAGFVRTMFYKRLSSCGHSFTLSLRRHLTRNELFQYALNTGRMVPTGLIPEADLPDDADLTSLESDDSSAYSTKSIPELYDALLTASPRGITWVRSEIFKEQLAADLERDSVAISELLRLFGDWAPEHDSKLAALVELVSVSHPTDKLLVFTEYKDTALYLAQRLDNVGIKDVAVATGQSENPTELAHRFSPISNSSLMDSNSSASDELRVLIATDVLSEGQNLQDSHIIVNYDLPWAIIKLIQRAGRVDRIGQRSDTVLVYSFFHQSIDNVLSLRQRIAARLSANAATFGSDEQFFGSREEVQAITDLYDGKLDDVNEGDEVDASSIAYEVWSRAQEDDPALAHRVASLPDMIDATRKRRLSDIDDGVVCFVRTASGIDGFGLAAPDGATRLLSGNEALRVFEATPEELGLELRDDHERLLAGLVRGPLAAPQGVAGRLRGVRRAIWMRLGETLANHDASTSAALDALYQHPLTADAERRLRRAVRHGIEDEALAERIATLHRDGQLVLQSIAGQDPIRIVSSMGVR